MKFMHAFRPRMNIGRFLKESIFCTEELQPVKSQPEKEEIVPVKVNYLCKTAIF
jgi:hypothetical protein